MNENNSNKLIFFIIGAVTIPLMAALIQALPDYLAYRQGLAQQQGPPVQQLVAPPTPNATATFQAEQIAQAVAATLAPQQTATAQVEATLTVAAEATMMQSAIHATLTAEVVLVPTHTPIPLQPTNTPKTAQPQIGDRWVNPKDDATYVYVPAGEFIMGSTEAQINEALALCVKYWGEPTGNECDRSWYEDEAPQQTIYLDGYWIMQTEVTNAQYTKCVEAGACEAPDNSFWDDANMKEHPVVDISWHQAQAYAEWVGGRLPTEAEWEKAARGTDGRLFPWGNQWDSSKANYCDRNCDRSWKDETGDDGYEGTAPVGSYPSGVSPYGALDMAGNVWEWTNTLYQDYPYQGDDGREDTSSDSRVVRGGAFGDNVNYMRPASRNNGDPNYQNRFLGVRVVASPSF